MYIFFIRIYINYYYIYINTFNLLKKQKKTYYNK